MAVMVAVTLDAAPVVQHAGTLLLLALAVAIVVGGPTERGPELEWHRMAGAVLMALAVLMHQHGESMATHHMTAGPRTDHGTVTGHDAALVLLRAPPRRLTSAGWRPHSSGCAIDRSRTCSIGSIWPWGQASRP
ncbi:hypothetical protein [Sphaerisporangium flaviroseum]